MIRVALVAILGYLLAMIVPPMLHLDMKWGAAGLTASAGAAGWIEFSLLRRSLQQRIGAVGIPFSFLARAWATACAVALPATALRWLIPAHWLVVRGIVILTVFGVSYLAAGHVLGLLDINDVRAMVLRRRAKR